ncbi:Mycothiol acetyltransferase [Actinomadura rubteroloni]|uniref:Mycothiol acetyltransferase n=1 Tax=Actinomadura rubteroloni TaxID=1926885 RepID=A0A2P4UP19_9ACTN|nr:mycothiol synthase [Actinomadura rubteroloni]POM26797.1 Mycothiol acetyltransferase [Actinomadura rubteroloni]
MREVRTLRADEVPIAAALVDAAAEADGIVPLSEQAMLALRHRAAGRVLTVGAEIVAYAHLDADGASAEFAVHPRHRRRGHGRALLDALVADAEGALRVWAHGDLPAAAGLARSAGLERVRALFQLRRPAADPLPDVRLAAGVGVRTFVPGRDEDAWLAVNARAFAHHPEQGAWTREDLLRREAADWFDPAGFFLAERDGALVGFHWTKIHPDGLGEVYVVGVDPSAQGLGLGRALTLTGLHHLRETGVPAILLYVDESNTAAVRLYESLSFTPHTTDVMYASEGFEPVT